MKGSRVREWRTQISSSVLNRLGGDSLLFHARTGSGPKKPMSPQAQTQTVWSVALRCPDRTPGPRSSLWREGGGFPVGPPLDFKDENDPPPG